MLRLWFGFKGRVNQRTYLSSGLGLFALKIGVDWALVNAFATLPFDFLNYFNAVLTQRLELMGEYPSWIPLVMGVWALPFIWIGISLSARRAIDAGLSGWFSLLFLLPVIHLLVIAGFCGLPSVDRGEADGEDASADRDEESKAHMVGSALLAVLATSTLGVGILILSVFGLGEYGSALFIATPFVMGVVSVLFVHRGGYRGFKASLGVAMSSVAICDDASRLGGGHLPVDDVPARFRTLSLRSGSRRWDASLQPGPEAFDCNHGALSSGAHGRGGAYAEDLGGLLGGVEHRD